jgi:hypothetical protein
LRPFWNGEAKSVPKNELQSANFKLQNEKSGVCPENLHFLRGSCKTLELESRRNRHSGQAKRDPESRIFKQFWIPAFAGMTD